MIEQNDILDSDSAADRNLALAGEHLRAVFADPALLETIPEGATLVLIPEDDPALARHNFELARHVFATDRNVYLYHVRSVPVAQTAGSGG